MADPWSPTASAFDHNRDVTPVDNAHASALLESCVRSKREFRAMRFGRRIPEGFRVVHEGEEGDRFALRYNGDSQYSKDRRILGIQRRHGYLTVVTEISQHELGYFGPADVPGHGTEYSHRFVKYRKLIQARIDAQWRGVLLEARLGSRVTKRTLLGSGSRLNDKKILVRSKNARQTPRQGQLLLFGDDYGERDTTSARFNKHGGIEFFQNCIVTHFGVVTIDFIPVQLRAAVVFALEHVVGRHEGIMHEVVARI